MGLPVGELSCCMACSNFILGNYRFVQVLGIFFS